MSKELKIKRNCKFCKEDFYIPKHRDKNGQRKYCSRLCLFKDLRGKNHPHFINGSNRYYQWRIAFERYGKKCTKCGSEKHIQLHHWDENRKNNEINNLTILCASCHRKLHRKLHPNSGEFKKGYYWNRWLGQFVKSIVL